MQHIVGAVDLPGQPHILGLDGDAALPLDIHPVQVLGAHRPLLDHTGELQHAVGQRRLAMVDVRDDAEVPDPGGIGERRVGEAGGHSTPHGYRQTAVHRPMREVAALSAVHRSAFRTTSQPR